MQTHLPSKPSTFSWRRPPAKYLALFGGLVLTLAFPDLALFLATHLLSLIGTVLHYVLGWLELGVKHLVQSAFDVSRHTAQMITAWIGLFAFLALLVWLLRSGWPRWRGFIANGLRPADSGRQPEACDSASES